MHIIVLHYSHISHNYFVSDDRLDQQYYLWRIFVWLYSVSIKLNVINEKEREREINRADKMCLYITTVITN